MLGIKRGMTQVFTPEGTLVPVTVIEAPPGQVLEVKTTEKHGYEAVKVGFFETSPKRLNKPLKGVFERAGLKKYFRYIKEFGLPGQVQVGQELTLEMFQKGEKVSVSGISKGKGFQGVMKRHGYHGGPGSHGSMFNRAPGSIGQSSFPSRVWKGKGMPGHMGSEKVTVRNLEVLEVRPQQNLLLLKGAVPGPRGAVLQIRKQ
jgi:large subunit ribosomal protein L3